jgi:hypothetical protein
MNVFLFDGRGKRKRILTLNRASGSVWKAEIKHEGSSDSSGEIVAIKKVELSVKTIESTLKEIRFMSDIHHPNALEYRECWLPKGEVWVNIFCFFLHFREAVNFWWLFCFPRTFSSYGSVLFCEFFDLHF